MRNIRALLRRPRWLCRPVAVLVAVVVGLSGLGGATGALLGELGGGPGMHQDRGQPGGGQPGGGRHHDARVGDLGNGVDADGDGDGGVPGPGR